MVAQLLERLSANETTRHHRRDKTKQDAADSTEVVLNTASKYGIKEAMKNWPYIAITLIALGAAGWWAYQQRDRLGLSALFGATHLSENADGNASMEAIKPASIQWRAVDQKANGFKIEMPSGSKGVEAPAVNESGGTEPVQMLRSSPDGDTVYAVTWADNPPIARASNHVPDSTLDRARDGMLAGTQTTLVSESRITVAGFPGREIFAHNSAGGILNVRLIYVPNGGNDRLYTLMALFPTAGARSEKDVARFFSSFTPARPATRG
jgi:hypothetical protein